MYFLLLVIGLPSLYLKGSGQEQISWKISSAYTVGMF